MKKITSLKSLPVLIALFCAVNFGYGQIVAWEMALAPGNQTIFSATTLNPNLNNPSILRRGGGLKAFVGDDLFNSNDFTVNGTRTDAINNGDYLEFQVSATTGYQVTFTTLNANFRRTNNGPVDFIWRYSTVGNPTATDFIDIGVEFKYNAATGFGQPVGPFDLSLVPVVPFGTTITFRLYGWGAKSTNGEFGLGIQGSGRLGNDLAIIGTVSAAAPCTSVSKWNGTSWFPSAPTSNTFVIIEGVYDTSVGGSQTSFDACSLFVTNTGSLNITDNKYVDAQNKLTVVAGGAITVQPYGAFVQNNDASINSISGTLQVIKETAPMNAWYEYTYWSSPVVGATFENAITDSNPNRRFLFNAQNFLDATAETNNNNATIPGQDDVDDDNNDWQWIPGGTVMQPGVGYATTLTPSAFAAGPGTDNKQFSYTFEGPFNNGIVNNVAIYRNDFEPDDNNWNLIGNPYPSAIDADAFVTQNMYDASTNLPGTIEGTIYFWSQDTNYSATENGNQQLNFDTLDYAYYNGTGGTEGGDGVTPNGYIPSGQGFFVSMHDEATNVSINQNGDLHDIAQGFVTFNNSMRVKGAIDNSQFFKTSNSKSKASTSANKLWVNLTSDNGVFNQILVGYVNGATNGDDGAYYDARKIVAPTAYAALYSIIENSDKKFAIQGKAPSSLTTDEIINIGFKTTINVATLYTLSVPKLEGDFLTGNPVYLKDNLTNTIHDLSASDYRFTSVVGEFNDRFQVGFNGQALSNADFNTDANSLTITQIDDHHMRFSASNSLTIKRVSIYDLLGRQLYQLVGSHNAETYNLANLSTTVFIAKVELSNGAIITKKAIKK